MTEQERWGVSPEVKVHYEIGVTGLKMAIFDCPHCRGLAVLPLKDDFVIPTDSATE
jgi:hypothetical protein